MAAAAALSWHQFSQNTDHIPGTCTAAIIAAAAATAANAIAAAATSNLMVHKDHIARKRHRRHAFGTFAGTSIIVNPRPRPSAVVADPLATLLCLRGRRYVVFHAFVFGTAKRACTPSEGSILNRCVSFPILLIQPWSAAGSLLWKHHIVSIAITLPHPETKKKIQIVWIQFIISTVQIDHGSMYRSVNIIC